MSIASYFKIQKTADSVGSVGRYTIEVYKITHSIYDSDMSLILAYHSGSITRGNKYKLLSHIFYYDLRKHYFSVRIVNI